MRNQDGESGDGALRSRTDRRPWRSRATLRESDVTTARTQPAVLLQGSQALRRATRRRLVRLAFAAPEATSRVYAFEEHDRAAE